jgi:hypothetical protein
MCEELQLQQLAILVSCTSEDMEFKQKSFASARKKSFQENKWKKYIFYERKVGCPFYSQFKDYIDSDVWFLILQNIK